MTSNELVEIGAELVEAARKRGATLRLFGGVAVRARCPSIETQPRLQREYADLDLVAPVSAWKTLPDLFISRGFRMRVSSAQRATFTRESLTVDLRGTLYRDYYTFDLAPRLDFDSLTLPLADLLLLKLQRLRMAEKDVQDVVALLLDHDVTGAGNPETIDREYLFKRTNANWGLWTTVFDNTIMLEKTLDRYLDRAEAQQVWRRIELIQEVMDGQDKSIRWWLRSIPNKRMKWYNEPVKEAEPETHKLSETFKFRI